MIRTGAEYIESIRDGREVWINGEQVKDVPTHPYFKPLVDIRARMYDMQHEEEHRDLLTYQDEASGETNTMFYKPPKTQQDWWDKYNGVNAVMNEVNGVVTRVGDETIGEVWSLYDGKDVLNSVDAQFGQNADRLLDALDAGLAAGGEAGPVHSAALVVCHTQSWPIADLRVDWHDNPVGQLRVVWGVYQPQMADYILRADNPIAAPSYGVPGDE